MILCREYEVEDWAKIEDPVEPFAPMNPNDDFLQATKRGLHVTGTEDGKVLACGGIMFESDTEGKVWLKVSKQIAGSFSWARSIKEVFNLMMEHVGDMNVGTYVLKDFCKGDRLARMINMRNTNETVEHNGNIYNLYEMI